MRNETNADDGSDVTKLYLAGSIDHSPDDGREWRDDLQNDSSYAAANVEFLNPLDLHDPREHEFERSDVVSDDLSLLDEADGILLKYDHGRKCWGTPAEQGYALAVNRHTDRNLPVSVWWDEMRQKWSSPTTVFTERTLEDASPWLHDPQCSIGVYEDQTTALMSLLSSTGHGANNPYPSEVDNGASEDSEGVTMLFEGAPLEEVLEIFCTWGVGTTIPQEVFDDLAGYTSNDVGDVLRFLETLGVVEYTRSRNAVMEDTTQSRQLLERFIPEHYSNMADGLSSMTWFPDDNTPVETSLD